MTASGPDARPRRARNGAVWALVAACGCGLGHTGAARDDAGARVAPSADADRGTPASIDDDAAAPAPPGSASACELEPWRSARPLSAKSIGHTSYVLKLRLEGGLTAVFKPQSRRPLGAVRYKGEVAAFRLSRALGLDDVPCAALRSFSGSELRAAFRDELAAADFDREAIVGADGRVRGALMPWIEHYEIVPLEARAERARWEAWLTMDEPPDSGADRALARDVSTLLAFDYVTGNWDRWSGANIARDGASGTLLFVDNDGAFFEKPPSRLLGRQAELLARVRRFSRSFIARLRALDDEALRSAVGDDDSGLPLLSDKVLALVAQRRRKVLDLVDEAVRRNGERETLAFQ